MRLIRLATLLSVPFMLLAQNSIYDRFFDIYLFRFNPSQATSYGFHQYDSKLEDYSKSNLDEQARVLHRFEQEFQAAPDSAERALVLSKIHADLLDIESIRTWERNPDIYSSTLTSSIFGIMSRKFAPEPDRLRSLIARERQAPRMFAAARANLKNPPRIYTEIALEQLPGMIRFFDKDVPLAFQNVQDAKLLEEFHDVNGATIHALGDYQRFLQQDLLSRSHGDFRLGAENYRKKLAYEEMADLPLGELLKIGYANLRKNQKHFAEIARQIDPRKTPREILDSLAKDHPAPDQLLASVRSVLGGLRDYIEQHKIVDIPAAPLPIVEETPPFMRALTFASMDTPGPYEKVAKEAFFNVTLPEPGWPPQQVEEHMESFNRFTITSTAIHEAYPGHYVQFLWVQQIPSKVRKLLGANSNVEGWAHYCEQMMLEEGYGAGDKKLRLGQLQDALLRDARYIVGIEMHTGQMSFEQGIDFFMKEGYQTRAAAERETKRGTSDPTYLYYTLGKLEILKLREDYRKLKGTQFNLREFHDAFLQQGYPPIKIVRQALLGSSAGVL